MNIEDNINELLAEAAPLRLLPEPEQDGLGALVDRINALRAMQAAGQVEFDGQEPVKRKYTRKAA